MKSNRRIKWLWDKRIVTRRNPVNDTPTETYHWGWFYKNGTHECYELFNREHLISSYKSYVWHISVLKHINEMNYDEFKDACIFISNIDNGFTKISMSMEKVIAMIDNVYNDDSEKCPPNKVRKVVFKLGCGLERHEKRIIVGQLIGNRKRFNSDDIHQSMQYIHQTNCRVTVASLSRAIECSRPTLYKVMNDEMRDEMKRLNELLKKDEELQRKELRTLQGRPKEESTSREALDRIYNRGVGNQIPTNG